MRYQFHLPSRTRNFGIACAIAIQARHSVLIDNRTSSSDRDVDIECKLRLARDDPQDDLTVIMKYSKTLMKVIPAQELGDAN